MQELPELDVYRAKLAEQFAGAQITGIEVLKEKVSQTGTDQLERDIALKALWFVERRGKHLVFHLDNGKRLLVQLSHGAYLYAGSEEDKPGRTASAKIRFGDRILYLVGLKTGDLQLLSVKEVEERLGALGPDPFDKRLTLEKFIARFAKKRGAIKSALMDQTVITGIGTVYSDEICHDAAIRPDAKIPSLGQDAWERLYQSMHKILKEAISYGGAGVHPFSEGDELTGGYSRHLKVFDREGEPCGQTGSAIETVDVSGRKAYFSPGFQTNQ
ncbi:Fpg/Nei family DNA glycosylase [Paenibacillus arenilitoris]|uniref:Fpg/Nei family DNA glycosylase n=1 Tax=Paenibacillus arenilitoris TaxID=2772299 RepID=A0A927CNH3_9BACL|nr:Fpg/Nei family DNA glycosylase [Paenibacillus arenilitoris]MBD2869813.1 Fpg/Nei family DNA glycosylase [Paenibacillus arenilitoris]